MIRAETIYVVAGVASATLTICVGIIAYARGCRAGIKVVKVELHSFEGGEWRHVSEDMRARLAAMHEGEQPTGETRH